MKKHKIGWLNVPGYVPETWNPIVGCSKISTGCENCYAEKWAARLAQILPPDNEYWCALRGDSPDKVNEWSGFTFLKESALEKPLHWKKPRAIFVNSMGDLFHGNTPDIWRDRVFAVMALCPQHLFIVLTKRADELERYFFQTLERKPHDFPVFGKEVRLSGDGAKASSCKCWKTAFHPEMFPLPNVWLGVTAENQEQADKRIPHLLRTPATCRFVSVEPMVGEVSLRWAKWHDFSERTPGYYHDRLDGARDLDWVICGGESGSGARAMDPEWARGLRDQCNGADVPFFFKQWGTHRTRDQLVPVGENAAFKGRGGDVLDGKRRHEFPLRLGSGQASIGKPKASSLKPKV